MLRNRLEQLLRPVVETLGYELWELEFAPRAKGGLLRLYIDVARGITLDDCEKVSHAVSDVLDAADPIPGHYTLEVSSPGLDRVLRTPAQFARYLGSPVRVEMAQAIGGRRRFLGRVTGVNSDDLTLAAEEGSVVLPISDIHRARLVPEY